MKTLLRIEGFILQDGSSTWGMGGTSTPVPQIFFSLEEIKKQDFGDCWKPVPVILTIEERKT